MTTNRIDHEARNWNTPTPNMVKEREEETLAFEAYRKEQESKKFKVRDTFGFSLYHTLAEAKAFALTLKDAEIIAL